MCVVPSAYCTMLGVMTISLEMHKVTMSAKVVILLQTHSVLDHVIVCADMQQAVQECF